MKNKHTHDFRSMCMPKTCHLTGESYCHAARRVSFSRLKILLVFCLFSSGMLHVQANEKPQQQRMRVTDQGRETFCLNITPLNKNHRTVNLKAPDQNTSPCLVKDQVSVDLFFDQQPMYLLLKGNIQSFTDWDMNWISPTHYQCMVPADTYDVLCEFDSLQPDLENRFFVYKDNIQISSNDTIEVFKTMATNRVTFSDKDEAGQEINYSDVLSSTMIIHFTFPTFDFNVSGTTDQPTAEKIFLNDLQNTKISFSKIFVFNGKADIIKYNDLLNGITDSLLLDMNSLDYRKIHCSIGQPMPEDTLRISVSDGLLNSYYSLQYKQVKQTNPDYDIYMICDYANTDPLLRKSGYIINYELKPFNHQFPYTTTYSIPLYFYGDTLVSSVYFPPIPSDYKNPNNWSISLMNNCPGFVARSINNKTKNKISIDPVIQGPLKEISTYEKSRSFFSLVKNGDTIAKDTLTKWSGSYKITEYTAYSFTSEDYFQLNEIEGVSRMKMDFDFSREDINSPLLKSFRIVDDSSNIQKILYQRQPYTLLLSAGDFEPAYDSNNSLRGFNYIPLKNIQFYLKNHDSTTWISYPLSETDFCDSLGGAGYSIELQNILNQFSDSDQVDIQINLTDSSDNATEYSLLPAFIVKKSSVGLPQSPEESKENTISIQPNPVSGTGNIEIYLGKPAQTELKVYNSAGRLISTLLSAPLDKGIHRIPFDPQQKLLLSPGIYLMEMSTQEISKMIKFIIL